MIKRQTSTVYDIFREKLIKQKGERLMRFSKLTKPELEQITKDANFTKDEEKIFKMLCANSSLEEISQRMLVSKSTISRSVKNIKDKIIRGDYIMNTVPIWEKVTLTVEEAAEYSNIGINKISSLLNEPGCSFVFLVGRGKRLVKRKEFEKYIEKTREI